MLVWFLKGKVKPGPLFSEGHQSSTVTDRHEVSVGRFVLVLHLQLFFPCSDLEQLPRLAPIPPPNTGCRCRGGHCVVATAAPKPSPRPMSAPTCVLPLRRAFWVLMSTSFCTFPSAASRTVVFSLILVTTPASYSPQSNLFPPIHQPNTDPQMNTVVLSTCDSSQGPQLSVLPHRVLPGDSRSSVWEGMLPLLLLSRFSHVRLCVTP